MTEPDRPLAQAPNATWLTWALVVVGVLWVAKAGLAPVTLAPLTVALGVVLLLNAVRFAPRGEDPARRRLPLLLLLAAPWILALVFGPLGLLPVTADPAQRRGLLLIQQGALAAGAGLPLLLLYPMRGARRFALVVGVLNFAACFAVYILSEVRILPDS